MAGADHPQGLTPGGSGGSGAPGDGARLQILDAVYRSPGGAGVQELAERLGLHVNTVRFHLDRLLADGQVSRAPERPYGRGRPRFTFTAGPRPQLHGGQRDYRQLAQMLAGLVAGLGADGPTRAADAGRRWGASLARRPAGRSADAGEARRELLRVLDEVGFAPRLEPQDDARHDEQRVLLRHCPFLEAAEAHPEVVCAVHRGLMDGVLAEIGAPVATDRLVPFAEPGGCVAHLVAAGAGGAESGR